MVEACNVAAWTGEDEMLSDLCISSVFEPPMTALGPTVNVCPATVTKVVEEPVGIATYEPPMYTDEDSTWTGTPLTKLTVAEAAP